MTRSHYCGESYVTMTLSLILTARTFLRIDKMHVTVQCYMLYVYPYAQQGYAFALVTSVCV